MQTQVLSDRELLQAVWGPEDGTEHGRLHVVVRQLRKKIERDPPVQRTCSPSAALGINCACRL